MSVSPTARHEGGAPSNNLIKDAPRRATVFVGAYYNPDKDIFTNESGDRLYPPKTATERLDEMEAQITDTQAALIELAGIIGGSDNG